MAKIKSKALTAIDDSVDTNDHKTEDEKPKVKKELEDFDEVSNEPEVSKENKNDSKSSSRQRGSQPTISDLFSKMNQKRKLENGDSEKTKKKIKTENDDKSSTNGTNGNAHKSVSLDKRCTDCQEFLNSPDLKLFSDDPPGAFEEFVTLTDPRLSVHTDGDYESDDVTERPQHKITNFSVYDRFTHLCAFDQGLIEQNVEVYFSGYVKPIYAEDPSPEGYIHFRRKT